MEKRRVAVTGLGAVTPLGNTAELTWQAAREGKCGIDRISLFDAGGYAVQIAAEVKGFSAADHGIDRKEARKMSRFSQFAAAAANEAIADAGFDAGAIGRCKSGVIMGNGLGGLDVIEAACKKYFDAGYERIPPLSAPLFIPNEAPAHVSILHGIDGPAWTLATACASGSDALGLALDLIRSGRIDVCVAGGTEASITGFSIGCFTVLQTLASSFNEDPKRASRPFDKDREGFVMGEGAGVLVLEELEHAKKRGARIYAEFAGYGASSDGYHITSPRPDGSGGALAIKRALDDAGLNPEEVQYYNAHGTSTPINDPAETQMVKTAFGDHARRMKISSTKSMTGHCIGAAGAIEAIISIQAMRDSFFPPTINLDSCDTEHGCDLDYVANKGCEGRIDCIASASLGFGGHNGCVIMKKYG